MGLTADDWIGVAKKELRRTSMPTGMFVGLFGMEPKLVSIVWRKNNKDGENHEPKHLLWAMCFLKTYNTESSMAAMFHTNRMTYRTHMWNLVRDIAYLDLVRIIIICHQKSLTAVDVAPCRVYCSKTSLIITLFEFKIVHKSSFEIG